MAYSSVAELRDNVPRITVAVMSDILVGARIDAADDTVVADLGNVVDFTLVTDTPAGAPRFINKLSQYKTAELSLVAKFSAKRMNVEITDWQYWQLEYEKLLDKIVAGEIDLEDVGMAGMSFTSTARDGVTPALGQGELGEHLNDADIEAQVAKYGKSDQ